MSKRPRVLWGSLPTTHPPSYSPGPVLGLVFGVLPFLTHFISSFLPTRLRVPGGHDLPVGPRVVLLPDCPDPPTVPASDRCAGPFPFRSRCPSGTPRTSTLGVMVGPLGVRLLSPTVG